MADIREAQRALVNRVVEGAGMLSPSVRRAAFDNGGISEPLGALVSKVAMRAHRVTDEDVATAKAAGFSEDQVFEAVVCAAVGQASRQYESALAALVAATGKE